MTGGDAWAILGYSPRHAQKEKGKRRSVYHRRTGRFYGIQYSFEDGKFCNFQIEDRYVIPCLNEKLNNVAD